MPLADGQVIADYTIVRHLGSGGMGEIYLAQHPRLPRQDALKVLPTAVTSDMEYRERFNREADMVASLWHPHIVAVHDRGEIDGQLWISMDFVEGTDAAQLLETRYPHGLPPDMVIRIVHGVADALDYAHQRQLLHRDVKPANILLAHPDTAEERILLGDFGIARWVDDTSKLTATNMTVGTVAYAAPEQLMGEHIDARADQYALAATAFHLLTGAPLFTHTNPAVVISQHLNTTPPPIGSRRPELSDLGPVFSKALAKSPDDRYDLCMDFAEALEQRIGSVAKEIGATDATVSAMPASKPKYKRLSPSRQNHQPSHRQAPPPAQRRSLLRPAIVVPFVVAFSLAAVAAMAILLFQDERALRTDINQNDRSTLPPVPVVFLGADCATLGGAGQTQDGKPAVCANHAGISIWSTASLVPTPSATPGPNDETYSGEIETQVRICVEQTGKSRIACREDIRKNNLSGPA